MPPNSRPGRKGGVPALLLRSLAAALALSACADDPPGLVLAGGRVVDPESGLDAIRWVAIDGGRVVEISQRSLGGRRVLNVTGMVIAPGFIDLHAPADAASAAALALDGVTTALLLEPGAHPVDAWYAERADRSLINFGASVSYARARGEPFPLRSGEGAALPDQPLDGTAMEALVRRVREGLADGGLGIGVVRSDVPGASAVEIEDLFAVAGFDAAPVFARPRDGSPAALDELLGAAALLGTPLHVVDLAGWSGDSFDAALARIDSARTAGLDVTTEVRLGGADARADQALAHPGVILSDDRGTGGFLRALGPYLDDEIGGLTDALARATWLPARRLEGAAPAFRRKGRLRVDADADLVVLDPGTMAVRHVIVGGVLVVQNGALIPGVAPGRALLGEGGLR